MAAPTAKEIADLRAADANAEIVIGYAPDDSQPLGYIALAAAEQFLEGLRLDGILNMLTPKELVASGMLQFHGLMLEHMKEMANVLKRTLDCVAHEQESCDCEACVRERERQHEEAH